MIFNHSPKSIFYTLTVTALLLTGCSGGGSSNTSNAEQSPAIAAISGVVTDEDGNGLNGIRVELDDGIQAKTIASTNTNTINNIDGRYTIQPNTTGTFQLKFSKGNNDSNFITQFKSIKVEAPTSGTAVDTSITPTILNKLNDPVTIPITGGPVNASDPNNELTKIVTTVNIPGGEKETINVSLTLLTGTEIPSKLPKGDDATTLLPIGTISLNIFSTDSPPVAIDSLLKPARASIPVPVSLQNNTNDPKNFPVYLLNEATAEWKLLQETLEPNVTFSGENNETLSFNVQNAGIYMVMSSVSNIEKNGDTLIPQADPITTEVGNISPGANVVRNPKNTISFGSNADSTVFNQLSDEEKTNLANLLSDNENEKAGNEIKALVRNLLEQQNQTQFNDSENVIVTAPAVSTNKQSFSELAAKLVCTVSLRRESTNFIFRFTFRGRPIAVPVTIIIGRFIVSCEDVPDPTGATGGTG